MKFIKFILALMAIVLPSLSWSQINTEDYIPYRDIEATDSGIVVTYTFRGGIHQPDPLHPGAKFWKIPGFGLNDNVTEPGFPFRWDSFTIPDNAEVNVTLLDSVYTDTLFALAPAYPPLLNSDTIGYTPERVPLISPYTGFYPNMAVLKGDIQSYRGQGIVRVATLPVQYNYQTGTVRAFSRIKYMVSFTDRNTRSKIRGRNYVSEIADSRISLSDHFLDNTTLNYKLSTNGRKNVQDRSGGTQAQLDNRDYLIISTPTYAEAVNRFAEWKRTKGFRTHVLLRNDWTVTLVKTSIMNLYNTEGVNLYYVLFVGDNNDVPAYANSNGVFRYHVTDYYYGCVQDTIMPNESRFILPSVKRGRLLVSNISEATCVINKIINYEENPPLSDSFYNTGTNCAFFEDFNNDRYEDSRSVLTTEEIKNYVESKGKNVNRLYYTFNIYNPLFWNKDEYAFGDSIPQDLRRPLYNWNSSRKDVVEKINEGTFYVYYDGHGAEDGWYNYSYLFNNSDVDSLINYNKLPVVFSMACLTGKYNISNCFAKKILTKQNGGCVAIIAASENCYKGLSDVLGVSFFNDLWPEPGLFINYPNSTSTNNYLVQSPIFDLGSMLDKGFYHLFNNDYYNWFQDWQNTFKNIMFEVFHVFGDPSMMIYTDSPLAIINPTINVNNNTISIQLTDGDARISFYTPGTTPVVDSYIGSSVDYVTTADSVIICIDRHNSIPYVVTYHKNEYIQNETITDTRTYVGKNIIIGRNVTNTKPVGDVIINGADVLIQGGNVVIQNGTTITNSNVVINPQ